VKSTAVEDAVRTSGAVGRVSLITISSRILGLVREQVKAFFLGTGTAADAFTVAFMIPNVLRRFLAEGVMSACVVPVFTEFLARKTEEEVRRFAAVLVGTFLVALLVIVSAGVLFAPWYVPLLFSSFPAEKQALAAALTAVLFPYVGFVALTALFQGVVNCHGRFSLPAFCPVAFNIVVIAGTVLFAPRTGGAAAQAQAARIMAGCVLAGGLVQAALLAGEFFRLGYFRLPVVSFRHEGVRRAARLLGPVVLGAGVYQINTIVALVLAARVPYEGACAALVYSNRLLELALGVFVVSVITVALPGLSRLWNGGGGARFFDQASFTLRLALLIGIPAGFGLFALRRHIIAVLFGFGAFGRVSEELTEQALRYHALGVPLIAWCRVLAQGFYAMQDTKTPLLAGALGAVCNIVLCLLLVGPMGHGGIALAMTLSSLAGAVWYLSAWLRRHGAGSLPGVLGFVVRCTAAAVGMAALCSFAGDSLLPVSPGSSHLIQAGNLALLILLGGAFFFISLRVLGERSLAELAGSILRVVRKP